MRALRGQERTVAPRPGESLAQLAAEPGEFTPRRPALLTPWETWSVTKD